MSKFYDISSPMSVSDIAALTGAEGAGKTMISGLAPLEKAGPGDISFLRPVGKAVAAHLEKVAEYKRMLSALKAGACFITEADAGLLPKGTIAMVTSDPELAFIKLKEHFYRDKAVRHRGISNKADIDTTAKIGKNVHIDSFVVVEEGVVIGDNCYIGAGARIKADCEVRADCIIRENAVISHAIIGNRCVIGEGSVIGSDGFGWHSSRTGHRWVPQLGRVILGDDVFVGANSTIARGAQGDTVVGRGTKIDTMCVISHNDVIGENCIMAGMSGIAGSTTLGDWVLLGAQGGISGHLKIGDGVQIGASGGVIQDLPAGAKVSGYPAQPIPDFLRQTALLRKMVRKKKVAD